MSTVEGMARTKHPPQNRIKEALGIRLYVLYTEGMRERRYGDTDLTNRLIDELILLILRLRKKENRA